VLALTAAEWISLVLAFAAVASLVVATAALRQGNKALRRTSQPLVVVHEVSSEVSARGEGFEYRVRLRNHGVAAAFNVRFGVKLAAASYPYTFGPSVERGAREIVEPGDPLPATGELVIPTPWAPYIAAEGQLQTSRVFWARYENAFGETWETRNPHDPTADLAIEALKPRELHRREADEAEYRIELERRLKDAGVTDADDALRADVDDAGKPTEKAQGAKP
jgi:hypothetical protein